MKSKKWQAIEEARDVLYLGDSATLAEIKHAYHRLSKKYHPDKGSGRGKGDPAKMYKLTAAYELLMHHCKEYRFSLTAPSVEEPDLYDPDEWWVERFGQDSFWNK